jgi:hypothetical protein
VFVQHCLRSENPFVDPALFKGRPFTGSALSFAPYGAAFGAMLISIALVPCSLPPDRFCGRQ